MPRQLRIEYSHAIDHVMNRGDSREPIFHDDLDRKRFVATLRAETSVPWKWISEQLHLGTWTHATGQVERRLIALLQRGGP
jgi:hypothetical protein